MRNTKDTAKWPMNLEKKNHSFNSSIRSIPKSGLCYAGNGNGKHMTHSPKNIEYHDNYSEGNRIFEKYNEFNLS